MFIMLCQAPSLSMCPQTLLPRIGFVSGHMRELTVLTAKEANGAEKPKPK